MCDVVVEGRAAAVLHVEYRRKETVRVRVFLLPSFGLPPGMNRCCAEVYRGLALGGWMDGTCMSYVGGACACACTYVCDAQSYRKRGKALSNGFVTTAPARSSNKYSRLQT